MLCCTLRMSSFVSLPTAQGQCRRLLGHAYNLHAKLFSLLVFRNLQRYMHYNGRWEAHVASQKLETKQVDEIKEKIVELEDNGTELKDYTWLSQVCVRL